MRTCWVIRQELEARAPLAQAPDGKDGWVVECPGCAVYGGARSCWEQCAGSPCCCAPLSVTCDFCEIYIAHRREIAGLLHPGQDCAAPLTAPSGDPCALLRNARSLGTPDSARNDDASRKRNEPSDHSPEGGQPLMEKVQFGVPTLWADHHTLKVRAALAPLAGVQDVVASPAFRMVAVSYDPAQVTPNAIAEALAAAGYPVAEAGQEVVAQPVPVQDGHRDPAWIRLGMRQFKTDERDLKTKR